MKDWDVCWTELKSLKGWLRNLRQAKCLNLFSWSKCPCLSSFFCLTVLTIPTLSNTTWPGFNCKIPMMRKTGLFGEEAMWRDVSIETQRRMYRTCSCSCYKFYILADEFDTLSILYIPVLFSFLITLQTCSDRHIFTSHCTKRADFQLRKWL